MNKKTKIIKISLDVFMTVVLILLMDKMVTGMAIHEIIGIAILIVAIIHNILNMKWIKAMTKNLFKREIPTKSKIMYFINIIAFIILTADVITGILISEILFPNIQVGDRQALISWHHFLSYWLLVIISIHIGLHWDVVLSGLKKLFKRINKNFKESIFVKIILKIMYLAIAIAGIISLAKPDVHNNFLLENTNKKMQNSTNTQKQYNNNSSTDNNSNPSQSTDSEDSSKQTTTGTTISLVTVDEVTSLQDYLGKLYCTGCGRHCPLTNPQCNKGVIRQEEEVDNYNDMYGTDESFNSSSSTNTGSNSNSGTKSNSSSSSSAKSNSSSSSSAKSNSSSSSSTKPNSSSNPNLSMPDSNNNSSNSSSTKGTAPSQNAGNDNISPKDLMQENDKESTNVSLIDYVWIMGFIIGGTYYVAKLPKEIKKKK